ncbi:MAG: Crp/Fnr family transcriptional regulator [Bacilli bacterium]|nr:Crp/Fnr family transcriptional regulator [Bacilli bacterium]
MASIFKNIGVKEKWKLLKELEATRLYFSKNTSLLRRISKANLIGVLDSGSVQIIRTDYNGNIIIISDLKEGDIFSTKFSLLDNVEYDIIAKEDSKIIFIDYDYILSGNQKKSSYYQKFLINLIEIMGELVYAQNKRINVLTRKTTREKLLEYFYNESRKKFTKTFILNFNYTELAEYLSIDRSAMMREIKRLKDDKIIETSGKRIRLLN